MKILFLTLTLFFITANAKKKTVKIECSDVRRYEWTHAGVLNICFVRGDLQSVDKFDKIDNGVANMAIQALGFQVQSKLKYIPGGLKKYYPNLVGLYFDETPLQILTEKNMEQFGTDLIHFHVTKSLITYLSKNLFKHNPNLKFLSLSNNPIQYIELGFFDVITRMDDLLLFDVRNIKCIDLKESSNDIKSNVWVDSCI